MSVFCVGQAVWDITSYLDEPLSSNRKYRVHDHAECAGGPALNAACLCALWGMPTELVARIGDDAHGIAVRKSLDAFGVGMQYLIPAGGAATPFSFIAVERGTGYRTIFNMPNLLPSAPYDPPARGPKVLLTDGHEVDASLALMRANPDAPSVIDAGTYRDGVVAVAREVDYIVCSEDFARQCTGESIDPADLARADRVLARIEEINRGAAVVTLGDRGLIYRDAAGCVRHMLAFEAETVDTTGAGDIFHGAFACGLYEGLSLEDNLRRSSMASALSVGRVGGQTSIPSRDEVECALRGAE